MIVSGLVISKPLAFVIYGCAAVGGAFAAGYAYSHFKSETWRYLGLCLATGGLVGIAIDLGTNSPTLAFATGHAGQDALVFLTSILAYLPAMFLIEEVAFRGAVDSHVHHQGDKYWVPSAIYVSALWGVWHAPMFGWDIIVTLLWVQIAVGVFLSTFWRKSGNLGVPAGTHALIDTVRNVLSGGPPG
jgi:membrane protease YdiL (CAAX protease family)